MKQSQYRKLLSDDINFALLERNMTKVALANRMGYARLSRGSIYRTLGGGNVSLRLLERIANALGKKLEVRLR